LTQPKADLLQGTLEMLILKALSLGPLHGYGIIQRIRQLSDELLEVEQGSLYPAVYRTPAARLDQFQVGCDRDRPPGQVLYADQGRE
jgi:Transcriptional regulator PadR-like family